MERARRELKGWFRTLAHRIGVPALERAYHRMRKDAAVSVDEVTKEQAEQRRAILEHLSLWDEPRPPRVTPGAASRESAELEYLPWVV